MITPSRIFLMIATLAGLGFAFATPPIRSPDENGHYLRIANVAASLFHRETRARDTVWLPQNITADSGAPSTTSAFEATFHWTVWNMKGKKPRAEIEIMSQPIILGSARHEGILK